MNRSALLLSALLLLAPAGCKQRQPASHPETTGPETTSQTGPSAAEIVTRYKALFAGKEDEDAVMKSPAFQELEALNGQAYQNELIRWIEKADSITITEHSNWTDFIPRESLEGGPKTEADAPKYDYQTVTLTAAQRKTFLEATAAMDTTSILIGKLCGFEPHHRMKFIRNDGQSSEMEICFGCGDVSWKDDFHLHPPQGLIPLLEGTIANAGLTPESDWQDRAQKWRERAGTTGREKPGR